LSARHPAAIERAKSLSQGGFLANHLHYAKTANDHEAMAFLSMQMIDHVSSLTLQSAPWQANSGMTTYTQLVQNPAALPETLAVIAQKTLELRRFEQLYEIHRVFPQAQPYVSKVLLAVAQLPGALGSIPARDIVEHYDLYSASLGELMNNLIEVSTEKSELAHTITGFEFDPKLADLYLKVLAYSGKNDEYKQYLASELRDVEKDVWDSELDQQGSLIDLVLRLRESIAPNQTLGLGSAFGDALEGHCRRLISGDVKVDRLRDRWPVLLDVLTPPSRTGLLYRLGEMVRGSDVSTAPVLEIYGDALLNSPEFASHADQLGFQAAPHIIEREVPVEIQWLNDALRRREIIEKMPKAAISEMNGRVASVNEEDFDDEKRGLFQSLRETLEKLS